MSLPPNDPSSRPSPASQGAWGAPGPAAPVPPHEQPHAPSAEQPPAQPAPQPAAAGHAPGSDLGADLGAALSFAGTTLLRNPVAYLVSGLVYCALLVLIIGGGTVGGSIALFASMGPAMSSDTAELTGVLAFYAIFAVALLVAAPLGLLWQTGAARSAEIVLEGGRPSIGQTMIGPMRILLTALLYGVVVLIGSLLFYLPGLIAAVLFLFAVPAALRGASPVEAMKESLALVKANLATAIVSYLVLMVISSVAGTIVVGLLVLTPFMVLFQVGLYERLSGRALPEPARG